VPLVRRAQRPIEQVRCGGNDARRGCGPGGCARRLEHAVGGRRRAQKTPELGFWRDGAAPMTPPWSLRATRSLVPTPLRLCLVCCFIIVHPGRSGDSPLQSSPQSKSAWLRRAFGKSSDLKRLGSAYQLTAVSGGSDRADHPEDGRALWPGRERNNLESHGDDEDGQMLGVEHFDPTPWDESPLAPSPATDEEPTGQPWFGKQVGHYDGGDDDDDSDGETQHGDGNDWPPGAPSDGRGVKVRHHSERRRRRALNSPNRMRDQGDEDSPEALASALRALKEIWRDCLASPGGRGAHDAHSAEHLAAVKQHPMFDPVRSELALVDSGNVLAATAWLERKTVLELRGAAAMAHHPTFRRFATKLPQVTRGIRFGAVDGMTHDMQEVIAVALAESAKAGYVALDDRVLDVVRSKGEAQHLPEKTLSKRRLLEALFALCHEMDEPFVVFLSRCGEGIFASQGAQTAVEAEMSRPSSRLLFCLSTVEELDSRVLPIPEVADVSYTTADGAKHGDTGGMATAMAGLRSRSSSGGPQRDLHAEDGGMLPPTYPPPSGQTTSAMSKTLPPTIVKLMEQLGEALAEIDGASSGSHAHGDTRRSDLGVHDDNEDEAEDDEDDDEDDEENEADSDETSWESEGSHDRPSSLSFDSKTASPLMWVNEIHRAFGDEKLAKKLAEQIAPLLADNSGTMPQGLSIGVILQQHGSAAGRGNGAKHSQHGNDAGMPDGKGALASLPAWLDAFLKKATREREAIGQSNAYPFSQSGDTTPHGRELSSSRVGAASNAPLDDRLGNRLAESFMVIEIPAPKVAQLKSQWEKWIEDEQKTFLTKYNAEVLKAVCKNSALECDVIDQHPQELVAMLGGQELTVPQAREIVLQALKFEVCFRANAGEKAPVKSKENGWPFQKTRGRKAQGGGKWMRYRGRQQHPNDGLGSKAQRAAALAAASESEWAEAFHDSGEDTVPHVSSVAHVDDLDDRPLSLSRMSMELAIAAVCETALPSSLTGVPVSRTTEQVAGLAKDKHERALVPNVIAPQDIGISYSQIGGLEDVKELLRQCITYPLKYPHLYQEGIAAEAVKGVLLFGPPGTGKTMLAKAVATEGGATFLSIDASSIENKWLGESEKNAKAMFTLARRLAPCVIFIDEIDSILSSREHGDDSSHGTLTSVKTTIMQEWDGLRTTGDRVVVIGSTNRPFDLDEAVLRRMPRRILVDLPDLGTREEILKVSLSKNRLAPDVNLTKIAQQLDGYTGSDIKEVCREAVVAISHEEAQRMEELSKARSAPGGEEGTAKFDPSTSASIAPGSSPLRPVNNTDFRRAIAKLSASVSERSREVLKVGDWNEQYGEIKKKKKKQAFSMYL